MPFLWRNFGLVHLVFAAFRAISLRFFEESFFALAGPPLSPPSLPRATAAGFFSLVGSEDRSLSWVASCTIWKARVLTSDGLFFSMPPFYH